MEQKRRNKTKHRRRGTHPVVHVLKAMGTLLLSIFLIIIITLSIFGTVLTIYVLNFADTTTDIMLEKSVESNITRFLYDNPDYDEETDDPKDKYVLYYTMRNEYRHQLWVDLDQIPQVVQDAFVYTEDERFYAHDGVDFKSTFAAFVNVFLPNRASRGGSTITQQTIKNLTGDDARSGVQGIERKIREVFRSINVEKTYTKEDILEIYLNVVPQNTQHDDIVGVQSAANFYFGKDVSELDLAEAACLAGMNNAPGLNNPIDNIENNNIRRQHCLERMLINGAISSEEYNEALNEPLELAGNFDYSSETIYDGELEDQGITDWYLDAAIEEAEERIADDKGIEIKEARELLYNGGYTVYTNVDIDMQHKVEKKMQDASNFTTWYMDPEDDTLWSGFVCMDYNGNVQCVVGGRNEKTESRNLYLVTHAKRQPGSCMKPIGSYAPALDQDLMTMTSYFNDSPIEIEVEGGKKEKWPVNYSEFDASQGNWSYKDLFTYQMLLKSLNTMPAQLVKQMTPAYSYNFMKSKLDVTSLNENDCDWSAVTVGGMDEGITLEELVGAYMIFGNGGKKYDVSYIYKIEDAAGKVLYEKTDGYKQAIADSTAYIMNRMMQYVINDKEGTGRYAKLKKTDLVGKTGTSSSWNDLNFVGCTPDYVSGIWIGYENPETIPTNDYQNIGEIWKNIFGDIADSEEHKSFDDTFPMPDTVVKLNFCTTSGLIATDRCGSQQVGYFKASNVPGYCYH
ncbi:transglycosylase domain-containing protein [Ruminococcus albus]|uniref:Penicillin-binding protein 1A n=1 Tax=Ruminococcus albus TaxID=1264 RepID=A0A1I1MWG2_RUMAL|nr:transglycosylase domain-containing protein [Ruminococcus albus]SFC85890.1 penicillin-binding protein 1A [Ruminococcus albus]